MLFRCKPRFSAQMSALIKNSLDILEEMMTDLASYDGPLGPGRYWSGNQRGTLDWLRRNDLNTFRTYQRHTGGLSNFGGSSWWRSHAVLLDQRDRLNRSLIHRLGQKLRIEPLRAAYRARIRDLFRERIAQAVVIDLMGQLLQERDADGELKRIEMTPLGSPDDLIDIGGRLYTPKFLTEFFVYLDMKRHLDFDAVETFVEVGPGVGVFAELMAKLRPTRRLYIIDIPPQLYVSQQVLSAIFPREVASYRAVKRNPGVLAAQDHRMFFLAPWQLDQLDLAGIDLAYNETSFAEMRKGTVQGYLANFDRWGVKDICVRGSEGGGKNAEGPTLDDFAGYLPNYNLMARVPIADEVSARPAEAKVRGPGRHVSALYFKRQERLDPNA